ncbi:MAG TPA: hypothetical protein PLJ42_06380 [Chitinophagales bacterium]|jgi:hypothetical protein|nr:hypothetical protein [Chitinophagales bacterium]HQV78566.1 hypothetical protein [Chitinophagales bacterium]HQW79048.1 hypothetical protein [Chitinophagales bacterium]HRB67421.1 hypothetical protein [Chitinophagales bacterium]HRB92199.1 hypothetical protein [Chitinophagales bacterium]
MILIVAYFYFLSPSAFEYRRNEKKLKENYGIIRGQLIKYTFGRGHGSFGYEFCVDSTSYYNAVSTKYFKKIDGKVGDTISIAYELSNVENNHPIFVLFKNDSIGKKYKHEFQ